MPETSGRCREVPRAPVVLAVLRRIATRKLLEIKFRGLSQVGDSFGHALTLRHRPCFGIARDEAALFGWNQDCGRTHGPGLTLRA
jgi:hypothetical protein